MENNLTDQELLAKLDEALNKVNDDPRVDLASMALHQAMKHERWTGAIEWATKQHGDIVNQVGKELGFEELFNWYNNHKGSHQ